MPHAGDIVRRFGEPGAERRRHAPCLAVVEAGVFTLRMALAGFVAGAVVGLVLAVADARLRIARAGLLPYVVAVADRAAGRPGAGRGGWGGKLSSAGSWQPWMSVAVIAAYLAFFPVAVGMLRGLQSPRPAALELMRSYAAAGGHAGQAAAAGVAAVPVPGAAAGGAAAVVGAVVGEISTGTEGGIGRLDHRVHPARPPPIRPRSTPPCSAPPSLGLVVAGLVGLLDVVADARTGRRTAHE